MGSWVLVLSLPFQVTGALPVTAAAVVVTAVWDVKTLAARRNSVSAGGP